MYREATRQLLVSSASEHTSQWLLLPTELGKARVFPEDPSTSKFFDLASHGMSLKNEDTPSVLRMLNRGRIPGDRLNGALAHLKEGKRRKEDK